MTTEFNIKDFISGKQEVDLSGKYLVAKTKHDGFTGTWDGNHYYKVVKEEPGYYVIGQKWDESKKTFVDNKLPIIDYDGTNIFYLTQTRIDPYNGEKGIKNKVSEEDAQVAIAQAFLAYIYGEFSNTSYDVFLLDEDTIMDAYADDDSTTEAPTTVAPTTVAPTTVAPTTVAPTTVDPASKG